MRSEIHSKDPKTILGRNLSAAFKKRGLSARSVARSLAASGMKISNKTVSNMLNGEGNPQLDNLLAVAKQARVPLWQLLSPVMDLSHLGKEDLHELIEGVAGLSEIGLSQVRRVIQGEHAINKLAEAQSARSDR
jgi:transcriptional regulator with XRE-family HTH domain